MFELTCPSCRVKRESSFVRIGAATRCPACGHGWRVSASHIAKLPPPRTIPGAGPGGGAGGIARPAEPVIGEEPPDDDPRADSSVTGMSGLSDLMQAEPIAAHGSMAGLVVAPVQEGRLITAPDPAAAATGRAEPRPAAMSRQSRRLAILVIALLAFGVALAGIGLAMLGGDEPAQPAPNPGRVTPGNAAPTPTAPNSPGDIADPLPLPAGPPAQPEPGEPHGRDEPGDESPPHGGVG